MKKTRRIISLMALLLAVVTLCTACGGINFRTDDASKYVSITEAGYKNIALSLDKTVISDKDVEQVLFDLRFDNKKATKNDTGEEIKQYDIVRVRLAIYDKNGNVVYSGFGIDSAKYNEKDSAGNPTYTLAATNNLAIDIGYGEYADKEITLDSTNKIVLPVSFLNTLEEKLYNTETPVKIGDFKVDNRWDNTTTTGGTVLTQMETPLKGFFSISYASSFGSEGKPGSSGAPLVLDTYLYEGKEIAKNSYMEAIYLGLAELVKNGHKLYCKNTPINIHIVPAKEDFNKDELDGIAKNEPDSVYIKYDLDFENTKDGTNYQRGLITTSLMMAYVPVDDSMGNGEGYAEAIELNFAPGESYAGQYKGKNGETIKMAGETFTVRVFAESRTGYDFPALTKDFIKEHGEHGHFLDELTDADTDETAIAKYKAHLKEEMQGEVNDELTAEAKELFWEKALAAATTEGMKTPKSFAKAYRNEEIEYLEYLYYTLGYSALYDNFKEFAVSYVNMGFDSHYTDMFKKHMTPDANGNYKFTLQTNAEGKNTRESVKAAYKQLKDIFYKEGLEVAKERALTYLLADLLGVRLTEAQLEEKLLATVKKENDAAYEQVRDICTVDADEEEAEAKKELVNALLLSDKSNQAALNKLTFAQLASAYLRSYYGVGSLAELPKEMVTRESYLDAVDEETLYGAYQLEAVKEKLYEVNKGKITFVEVDTDGEKLEKDS